MTSVPRVPDMQPRGPCRSQLIGIDRRSGANLGAQREADANDRRVKHGAMKREMFLIELGGWEWVCEFLLVGELREATRQPANQSGYNTVHSANQSETRFSRTPMMRSSLVEKFLQSPNNYGHGESN
jgi:hypothetical protein